MSRFNDSFTQRTESSLTQYVLILDVFFQKSSLVESGNPDLAIFDVYGERDRRIFGYSCLRFHAHNNINRINRNRVVTEVIS